MDSPTLQEPPVRTRRGEPAEIDSQHNGEENHLDEIPAADELPRPSYLLLAALGVVLVLVVAAALALGWLPKLHRSAVLDAEAEAAANELPAVSVQLPTRSPQATSLQLPGSIQPLQETAIYARTTGYLKSWSADYGAHVKKDQPLADIDAPEVDEQLQQARSDVAAAEANVSRSQLDLEYMDTTRQRYEELFKTNSATPQELDQHHADWAKSRTALAMAKATLLADQANVKRLEDLQSFEKITAPFAGTITARNFDVGALITANGTMGGMPLFRLEETDILRVWVNVPQSYATMIKPGLEAQVSVREYPSHTFNGTVAHTAGALDSQTRTLLTEVRVPNPDGKLFAGMYAQVNFQVTNPAPPLIIPVSALITNAQGNQAAVVDDNGVVHYKSIDLGRDFGATVEVTSGLGADDKIVTNPGERLTDGGKVRVISKT